jgi:prepilin-type N-terminal cleavage/methylation domain-containing protein
MLKVISPFVVASRRRIRDSFTLVEILVVIAIIAILASVALPAITGAIKKANENAAMQSARGLELGCFQYANDNNQTYPGGATSTLFFQALVPNYVNNTDVLYINGTSGKSKATVSTNIVAANVCWDTTVQTTSNAGLTSSDPDQTPVIMSTGGSSYNYGTVGTAAAATAQLSAGTDSPFGTQGLAVAYKAGNAAFMPCTNSSQSFPISSTSFVPAASGGYTAVKP